jgi:hypothetical protein
MLSRIAELELDLSSTISANNRLSDDIESLNSVHSDLIDSYQV